MRDMFQLRRVAESLSAMERISEKTRNSQVLRGSIKNLHFDYEIPFFKKLTQRDRREHSLALREL